MNLNLFSFNKIRKTGKDINIQKKSYKRKDFNLNRKQNLSFFASAINHIIVRKEIIEAILSADFIDENELNFMKELKKNQLISLPKDIIYKNIENTDFITIAKKSLSQHIYDLFPYSAPKFDPHLSLEEIKKSIKNLNTRLSNLKKINKSLDNFVNNSNQLNWSDLQKINIEILNED